MLQNTLDFMQHFLYKLSSENTSNQNLASHCLMFSVYLEEYQGMPYCAQCESAVIDSEALSSLLKLNSKLF